MLHPSLLAEMLDAEVDLAQQRLGERARDLRHDGRFVTCSLPSPDGSPLELRLDALRYDGEPVRVDVCGTNGPVGPERWPAGLMHSIHPVTGLPFACIQGVYEYYIHPSHLQDSWDSIRANKRIPEILDHLLRKAGR